MAGNPVSDPAPIDSTLQAPAGQPFWARFHLRGRDAATVQLMCRWIEMDLAASGRRAPR
jgi:hypothetical protein